MIDASFPEPNHTSVKKGVGRLGGWDAKGEKGNDERRKIELWD